MAYIDVRDRFHRDAVLTFERLAGNGSLVVHSYAVSETISLVQRRIGMEALRDYAMFLEPALEVAWVDDRLHRRALASLLAADRRGISFVDHVSFEVMRDLDIDTAFTFDGDFAAQGFTVVP